MVGIQFDSISNFEDKAWRTIRATVSLIGVYLAGLSLLSKVGERGLTISVADVLPIIVGTIALIGTIYYAVLVLVGVKVGFGPSTDLSDTVNEGNVDDEVYDGLLVESYSNTVTENWGVLKEKSKNLRRSLASLIFGLVEVVLGFLLIIMTWVDSEELINPDILSPIKYAVWAVFSLLAGVIVFSRIWKENTEDDDADGAEDNGAG